MIDLMTLLRGLRRPALLIRAARIGQGDYVRRRDLARILRTSRLPASGAAVMALMEREAELDERRRSGAAGYTVAAHVEVLAALMAEARGLADRG
jgi:hypothetical protein